MAQQAQPTQRLQAVHGLWVPPEVRETAPAAELAHEVAGHQLLARLALPNDLRGAREPLALLAAPPYALTHNGRDTGITVRDLDEVVASPQGRILLLRGGRGWLAWQGGGW